MCSFPLVALKNAPAAIIDGDRGKVYPKLADFGLEGFCLFLNAGNVTVSGFDFSSCSFITPEKDKALRKGKLKRGDVVLTTRGTVGNVALYDETVPYDHVRINSGMVLLRSDQDELIPRFLYFFLRSSSFKNQVRSLTTGSAQPQFPIRDIIRVMMPLPNLPDQRSIAHILGTLDDKIELNRRMSQTLEAITRAIFKSWFIDFDPVIDNAILNGKPIPDEFAERAEVRREILARSNRGEGVAGYRHLFPDSFQDSPLGKIPKGWEVGRLDEHIEFALGGDWGKEAPTDTNTESAYCIRGTDLPTLQQGQLPELRLRYLKPSSLVKRSLRPFDLVFEVSGGSPTQSTGRSLLVNETLLDSYDHPLVCTNFCRLVRFSTKETGLFASFLLDRLYSTGEFFAHETGTTTIKNFAFKRFAEGFELVFPDRWVLSAFAQAIGPLLAKHAQNGNQSDLVARKRDTLLPRLLSGETKPVAIGDGDAND